LLAKNKNIILIAILSIIVVHHDKSIKQNIKCELECLTDENGSFLDNVDFCNLEKISGHQNLVFEYHNWTDIIQGKYNESYWTATYINSMMWRWFPINDPFVDVFMSRDSDSLIIQREVDSVNVWLQSSEVGHIMRGIVNLIFQNYLLQFFYLFYNRRSSSTWNSNTR